MDPGKTHLLDALGKKRPLSGHTADGVLQSLVSVGLSETPRMLCPGGGRHLPVLPSPLRPAACEGDEGFVGQWTAFSLGRFLLGDIQLRTHIQCPHHILDLRRNGESQHGVQRESIDRQWSQ